MIKRSHKLGSMRPEVLHCELSNSDGYAKDWHSHDCHMLLLPRHGNLLLSTEDRRSHVSLSRLSFAVIAPGLGHATLAGDGRQSHLTLYVDPAYLVHYGPDHVGMDLDDAIDGQGQWQRSTILDSILSLHEQILPMNKAGSGVHRLHHLYHLLLEECLRIVAVGQRIPAAGHCGNNALLIRQVQHFIADNLQVHHNIDALCHQFHLSRRHLTRLFRDVTQETVLDYANRQRVELAHRLICSQGMSAIDAGMAVGIDSPSYLARLFRKYLGVLPSDCRKQH